ncbi:hypothetical protein SCLCIDRAFT_32110 [Scleroderma citrinum Foug A]|uniref:protein disulfide-isomerase n=1 Tax=Scleroderma citrinum Foug A TaxID=1036808 RepID=A0A0C3DAS2_9AGAM|nr:hypothetical protein SCLCIDRAFT_32110 [Scleroderma citrinum Foug A]
MVLIAYVSSTSKAPAPEFTALAEKNRDNYLFGITSDPQAIKAAGVPTPAVVLYRTFDEPTTAFPYPVSSSKVEDFENWLNELAIPILGEVNGDMYEIYVTSGRPLAYLFVDPSEKKTQDYIDASSLWLPSIAASFIIQNLESQLKYPYDQSKVIEAAAVSAMVANYLDGKLMPKLKSQPIPETQDESDVFIEFYAPWCGHCKRLKPTWDSLADRFVDAKDRLVMCVSTFYDGLLSYAFCLFKLAGSRDFIDYDGGRSLESLIAFVEEKAKNNLTPKVKAPEQEAQATFAKPSEDQDEL